jgi:hypothetical protein
MLSGITIVAYGVGGRENLFYNLPHPLYPPLLSSYQGEGEGIKKEGQNPS